MDGRFEVPIRRRSSRIRRREIDEVASKATFDYSQAFSSLVGLGREMGNLARIMDSVGQNLESTGMIENLSSALEHIDWLRRDYAHKYPAMFRIGQCRDLYVMLCVRIQHCREILDILEALPPQTLPPAAFDALSGHTPTTEDICTICLEKGVGYWVRLPCGHAFHRECAKEWLMKRQRTCPVCRNALRLT